MASRIRMQHRLTFAAALAGSAVIAAPAHAAGGFLEFLFGRPSTPAPYYAPRYAPDSFDMTVRAHKRKVARKAKEGEETSHAHLQQPLDPANDREWFLKDPTLRKGDIIVLSNRVVVFTGARGEARMADFANLYATSLVSKKDQEKVRGITQAPREALVHYQAVPAAPVAAAATTVEQAGFTAKPVASTEPLRP